MEPGAGELSVVVIEDEEIMQWGLRSLLVSQSWCIEYLAAKSITGAIPLVERYGPSIAVVDVRILGSDPAAACQRLSAVLPELRILLLTEADAISPATVRAYGAVGFVSRRWGARDVVRAIRSTGGTAARDRSDEAAPPDLTARQREILHLIAAGETNSEIAKRLFLSQNTVKQHTSVLYRKLGVRNRAHAVEAAVQRGLIRG